MEVLDPETGITILRFGKPLEFTVTEGKGPTGDPFGYAGFFQTNRMGARAEYLWIAVPVDGTLTEGPVVEVDGAVLELANGANNPSVAALKSGPYASPAPWAVQFWYPVDAAIVDKLARATRITIRTRDSIGPWTFASQPDPLARVLTYQQTR
jgi:hypothetical protein